MNALLDRTEPEAAEMPFAIEEVFYSRTDKRGVIASGNSVFQRISGFSWEQLLGAPHRIVRNSDTPRAIFHLMWRTIQAGEACVAYIRNKTLDGRAYWVIATVFPLDDGYLSVRIKPTSPLFATIKSLYANLALAERTEGLTPDASEQRLLAELAKLGYADYQGFMQAALLAEYRARNNNPLLGTYFNELDKVNAGLDSTTKLQVDLLRSFDRLRDLPTNMRIIASRLEPSGGPISAISDIYSATSGELFQEITDFAQGKKSLSRRMQQAFDKATFLRLFAQLQGEVVLRTSDEKFENPRIERRVEVAILSKLSQHCEVQAMTGLAEAEQLAGAMTRASSDLRRSMLGLDTIRVMGRVESGRLGAEGNRIGATIDQIDECHSGIIGLLQKIMDNTSIVSSGVNAIRTQSTNKFNASR
ncbi:MAG: PAS domain S-box protein [Candidatus Saccharibacteria bacterium]|nr:PAS domain S-box protein [Pseudorhodobacter sp.]